MSTSISLPEAVRGNWYFVSADFEVENGLQQDREVLAFGGDGTFHHYEIEDRRRTHTGDGEYSFDGDFLILRGRKTRTFRVARPACWRWELEGKNDVFALYRGFVTGDRLRNVSREIRRDIQLLPGRARLEADFDEEDVVHRVVYDREDGTRQLASLSLQEDAETIWVGVTPLVRGIEPEVWARVVRESLFEKRLESAGNVTVHLFEDDRTLEI